MERDAHSRSVDLSDNDAERLSPGAAIEAVRAAVGSWDGVTMHDHRFGGIEFRLGRRELGHVHRTFADLPFPRRVRDELIAAGLAAAHHVLPESGWVTVPMRTPSEVANVIDLFRRNYERGPNSRT
jgi:Family of unknown function (DUF5519)